MIPELAQISVNDLICFIAEDNFATLVNDEELVYQVVHEISGVSTMLERMSKRCLLSLHLEREKLCRL